MSDSADSCEVRGTGRIHRLPPDVAEKIAAGEVIERPASVVKELLENSLDAGARSISVVLHKGGKNLIRVQDDGEGIAPEDLPLAVSRYATSKLRAAEDLWRIGTFGFRGEALASIGRVAELTITSKRREGEGATISVRGGEIGEVKPAACPPGTIVEVRNLFFTVPARRKFLKRDATEFAHAAQWIVRAALGVPGVGFRLENETAVVWNVPRSSPLAERIALFFGEEVSRKLLTLEIKGPVSVSGVVGRPEVWRSDRRYLYVYVNGRFVRDRLITQAVTEAFRGYLVPGRFPFAVIKVELSPAEVDSNVHPAKAEVKFARPQQVFQAVFRAVRTALEGAGPRRVDLGPQKAERVFAPDDRVSPSQVAEALLGPETKEFEAPGRPEGASVLAEAQAPESSEPGRPELGAVRSAAVRPVNVLQVGKRYLVYEGEEGLEIVDQHALHEKALYNKIIKRLAAGGVPSQGLLAPVPVRLRPDELIDLEQRRELLTKAGFSFEIAAGGVVMLTGIPALEGDTDPEDLFRAVLSIPAGAGEEEVLRRTAAALACRMAVKSGAVLSEREAAALLDMAVSEAGMETCPHGRPTRLRLTYKQLEEYFDRR